MAPYRARRGLMSGLMSGTVSGPLIGGRRRSPGLFLLAPAVTLTVVVIGTGVGAVLLTSVGLLPLYGEPRASLAGYTAVAGDLGTGLRESLLIASVATAAAVAVGLVTAITLLRGGRLTRVTAALAASVIPVPHLVGAAAVALLASGGGVLPRLLGVARTTGRNWSVVAGRSPPWPSSPGRSRRSWLWW